MYVTRPLSLYRRSPEAAFEPPPNGPGSGYLVIQDEEYEAQATRCFGLCRDPSIKDLPFPQNRRLKVEYIQNNGQSTIIYIDPVFFIPVIDRPLSSNRYYVIIGKGKHEGKVSTCSTEDQMGTCCFCCKCVKDVKPSYFHHNNIYQQVEIFPYNGCCRGTFHAKSVASDGFPRQFLRRKVWTVHASKPSSTPYCKLGEASGINTSLRTRMPDLDISAVGTSNFSPSVVVGKWYCPFIFVREGVEAKHQLQSSMFYEMTLEQFWEEIYSSENLHGRENVRIQVETPLLYGREAVQDDMPVVDGMKWFKPVKQIMGSEGLGLSMVIVERMRWEQERGDWVDGDGKVEWNGEFDGKINEYQRLRCFVLVERFVLKRMDGSVALTHDFRHTNKLRSIAA